MANPYIYLRQGLIDIDMGKWELLWEMMFIGLLLFYDFASLKGSVVGWINKRNIVVRYCFYLSILALIICFRAAGEAEFVYFQF